MRYVARINAVIAIMATVVGRSLAVADQRLEDMSDTTSVLARADNAQERSPVSPRIEVFAQLDVGDWRGN